MKKAVLLLGSNMGDRAFYLSVALKKLAQNDIRTLKQSPVYESPAEGYDSANTYYNIAVVVETGLPPKTLLATCLTIENELDRTRSLTQRYTDRTIDIDIILFENEIVRTTELTIPHPRMHQRLFCLIPLCEIAPHWIIPTLNKTVEATLKSITSNTKVTKVNVEL